jgi:hypothetical protein
MEPTEPTPGITRRTVLKRGGGTALAVLAAGGPLAEIAVAVGPGRASFLGEQEIETLRGLVDRFVPGKPEDSDDGAVAAGCAEAIDALLGAFEVDPPRIYAGGPFSDRGGARRNRFEHFVELDQYEERAWRLRIQGSRGRPELEFNGPVTGFQAIYRNGLAALERAGGPAGFAALPGIARDLVLGTANVPDINGLVQVTFLHTLELMYAAPEYGANRDLVGWRYAHYDGDVQPRGFTPEEIAGPGAGGRLDLRALPDGVELDDVLALAPLAASDSFAVSLAGGGLTLPELRSRVEVILQSVKPSSAG